MNFKPIIFSTPMVQAILAGIKTMTMRVVKTQPNCNSNELVKDTIWGWCHKVKIQEKPDKFEVKQIFKCPFGEIGDVLWVRETIIDDQETGWIYKDGTPCVYLNTIAFQNGKRCVPSIYMPKSACRIFLKITDIRVERLQEISEEDAKSEGSELYNNYDGTHGGHDAPMAYKESFARLWKSINGVQSWNDNPFVWVISFEKTEKPINF